MLLDEDLEVLVDDGNGEEDSGSGSDGSHEVGGNGEGSNAESSEGSGGRDVTVEFVDHGLLTMSTHDHLLLLELLGNILGGRSGHIDPGLGEESARSEHEDDVDDAVDRVLEDVSERLWWREIIANS